MKIRFGKDATGPFVEVTHTVRDQDDLIGADFYALDPEDRAKVCEHLPRAVNDRQAVRDYSEAEATPQPGTVAALLAKAEEARAELRLFAERGAHHALAGAEVHRARCEAALDALRATLGAPSPLDGVVAEVCALSPFLADVSGGPGTVADAWRDIAREMREPRGRDGLLTIAGLAMYGALACDAAKGGA